MTLELAYKKLEDYYNNLRLNAAADLTARELQVRASNPNIAALMDKRAALPIACMKQALADKTRAKEIADNMKLEGLRLNAQIQTALVAAGYPDDFLKTHYACPVCRDTGYLRDKGTPPPVCECYKRALNALLASDKGASAVPQSRFEAFDAGRIPETEVRPGITQRAYALKMKSICESYANRFPKNTKPNMIISGATGVGKTFLLSCIAERINTRGYAANIITSFRLLEIMREAHINSESGYEEFELMMECPLLMIDDLGSEPILRNVSKEYLCNLLNERILRQLPFVITTNLSAEQIGEMYGERVMSRLCDKQSTEYIQLLGKDLRRP